MEGAWTFSTVQNSTNYSPRVAILLDKVLCRLPAGRGTGAPAALSLLGSLPLPLLPPSLSPSQLVLVIQLASFLSSSEDASSGTLSAGAGSAAALSRPRPRPRPRARPPAWPLSAAWAAVVLDLRAGQHSKELNGLCSPRWLVQVMSAQHKSARRRGDGQAAEQSHYL